MDKKEQQAIRALERAFQKCAEAGIRLCGMDSDLHYATRDALSVEVPDKGYSRVANAVQLIELKKPSVSTGSR